jgi:hypothetical protein
MPHTKIATTVLALRATHSLRDVSQRRAPPLRPASCGSLGGYDHDRISVSRRTGQSCRSVDLQSSAAGSSRARFSPITGRSVYPVSASIDYCIYAMVGLAYSIIEAVRARPNEIIFSLIREGRVPSKSAWIEIRNKYFESLSEEERAIVNALADGKSMPEIGNQLGQHRSKIWRKTKKIEKRFEQ